ncbi:hypothetical protein [Lentilactobacillus kisonensis]|uniref:hypothetical protein n=1 Tax=Lentilactobacillus kisonensis TaxID=481722 RepID=UPI001FB21204|nr:hypothetical protein [Lentilactobacillus kisonensis]
MTNSKKNSQLQFALRVAITLLIWLLFANVPLKTFFEDSSQIQLILISIPFAILLNQVAAPNKNTLVTVICDSLVGLLSIHLFLHAGYLNTALLLIDFIFANILLLTPLVNEPHGRWIIFGIINGSGMAFLFNISYHHYFSLISLMYITTLIFSNIFFFISWIYDKAKPVITFNYFDFNCHALFDTSIIISTNDFINHNSWLLFIF